MSVTPLEAGRPNDSEDVTPDGSVMADPTSSDGMLPGGGAHVPTASFALAQSVARLTTDQRSIAGFFGNPGTGKTHAMRYFAERCPVEYAYITATPVPQRKEIFEEILLALTGTFDNVPERRLRHDCATLLSEKPRVLIIDECQHLSPMWHQQLRDLHDRTNGFGLLLAGGVNTEVRLTNHPEVRSRIAMTVRFEALKGAELAAALQQFHPILAATKPEFLAEIDRRDCRGNFRAWSQIVNLACKLCPPTRRSRGLTPKLVGAIFAVRGLS